MRKIAIGVLLVLVACHAQLQGQSGVTQQALFRTFMIQTSIERGTVFSIDVDHREYWITAKHLFTGIKTGPAGVYETKAVTVNILSAIGEGGDGDNQHWLPVNFAVIDPGKDIDILVLAPKEPLLERFSEDFTLKADEGGEMVGGECAFLGFPYGGGWRAKWGDRWKWWPFIKHCYMSGSITDGNISIWVLDGINNEGFSGGPVLYGTGINQQVFAVVSGYHTEVLEVLPAQTPDGKPTGAPPLPLPAKENPSDKQIVKANSGFILAFDIQPAIKAIRKNPIGPLRVPKK